LTENPNIEARPGPPLLGSNSTAQGCITEAVIKEYLKQNPNTPKAASETLVADPNTSHPLYFWQLYSVLDHNQILNILRSFYTSVRQDKVFPQLALAFPQLTKWEAHAKRQAEFWVDAMGGGCQFPKGMSHVLSHHSKGCGLAILNHMGAQRWSYHMRIALAESDLGHDPRARGTLESFLDSRMIEYARTFNFSTSDVYFTAQRSDDVVWTNAKGPFCINGGSGGNRGIYWVNDTGPYGIEVKAPPTGNEVKISLTFIILLSATFCCIFSVMLCRTRNLGTEQSGNPS